MKKRVVSLAICIAMLLSLAAGCSQPAQEEQESPAATETAATEAAEAEDTATETTAPASTSAEAYTYADTIAWDGEYDVIVVGFGGAGAVAASYAARAGAQVLLTEKAPEGHEGGNTRYCGQLVVTVDDKEEGMKYYRALAGNNEFPEAAIDVYLDGLLNMRNILQEDYGVETVYSGRENPIVAPAIPEYPELEGNETIDLVTVTPEISNAALWNVMRQDVMDRADMIDVWFEAPGKHLIQDPVSKAIIGVQIEKQGKLVNIRAKNGVVLATGGFENNAEMRETYLGLPRAAVAGSLYNTGDGIKMAMEVGADLWHMEIWEGVAGYGGSSFVVGEDEHASLMITPFHYNNGSLILVDDGGNRFIAEDYWPRHGHIYLSGFWHHPTFPNEYYLVYDQAQKETFDETGAIFEKFQPQVQSADSLEALAEKLGTENLARTVEIYNGFAETGEDLALKRSAASMTPLSSGPYYAIELMPLMLNTQGGPKRNEKAEVIDTNGDPIPNLYSAGELGGITANLYQGGGNMSECIVYGQIAGTNAAAPKDALPSMPTQTESNIVYTLGNDPDAAAAQEFATAENEYVGQGQGMGGAITVKVRMDGDAIASVEVLEHMETAGICEPAIERVPAEIVAAQSADVDAVSGATMTSNGIMDAVKDALSKAS